MPWLDGASFERLQRAMEYFLLELRVRRMARRGGVRSVLRLAELPLQWRNRNHVYALPAELWLARTRQWLTMRRSLLTGAPLGKSLAPSVRW